jgi:hypothetical protein
MNSLFGCLARLLSFGVNMPGQFHFWRLKNSTCLRRRTASSRFLYGPPIFLLVFSESTKYPAFRLTIINLILGLFCGKIQAFGLYCPARLASMSNASRGGSANGPPRVDEQRESRRVGQPMYIVYVLKAESRRRVMSG